MADLDASNPLAVIVGFFAILGTALMFLVKIVQITVTTGLLGGLVGIGAMFLVFFKTFGDK
jgi:hypothetical protein